MIQPTRWYERSPGDTSSMRIIAMMVAVASCIVVLGALVAMFLGYTNSTSMAGIGAGMVTFAEIGKAAQAFSEGKHA